MPTTGSKKEHVSDERPPRHDSSRPATGWKFCAFLTLALAAFLMFYQINRYPISLSMYEGLCGLSALKVNEGDRAQISKIWEKPIRNQTGGGSGVGSAEANPFLIYPMALSFKLFGCDDHYLSLRLVPMLYGIFSIGLLYLLGARMFNRPVGLLASFWLAVSSWALTYSRVGNGLSVAIFYALLCFYLLAIADGYLKWPVYILLGALGALATYFYLPARIVAPVAVLALLDRMLTEKGYFRSHWLPFLLLLGAFWGCLYLQKGNLMTFFRGNVPMAFLTWNQTSLPLAEAFRRYITFGLRKAFLEWSWIMDAIMEREGGVDPVTRYCFFLGLIWLLIKIRQHNFRFLLIWVVAAVLPMLITTPELRRAIMVVPAIYLIAAVGTYFSLSLLTGWAGIVGKLFLILSLSGLMAATAYFNLDSYFGLYRKAEANPGHPYVIRREQRKKFVELLANSKVYTDLCIAEFGWPESMEFEAKRKGFGPDRFKLLPADQAREEFHNSAPPAALLLQDGTLETK